MRLLPAGPGDMETIDDLCREQNRRDGTDYAPPRCFTADWSGPEAPVWRPNPNVPLALKLVGGGAIRAAYCFERGLEFQSFGGGARETALALRELPAALYLLEQQGYEGFHARIPRAIVDQWERSLGKRLRMHRDDDRLAHFYRRLRETA